MKCTMKDQVIRIIRGYVNSMIETHLSLWDILLEQQQIKNLFYNSGHHKYVMLYSTDINKDEICSNSLTVKKKKKS